MYSLISGKNNKVELSIVKYLFWSAILTIGEPDLLDTLIGLIQSWS